MSQQLSGSDSLHSACLSISDPSMVGEARRKAHILCKQNEYDEQTEGRVGIVLTELGTNLCRHGKKGAIYLRPLSGRSSGQFSAQPGIEILAVDSGPGMEDVTLCMSDGFSSGSTMGSGLGAVRRQSDRFDIYSQQGKGTVILSQLFSGGPASSHSSDSSAASRGPRIADFGVICTPYPGEKASGDGWFFHESAQDIALLVVDGLGHGSAASEASTVALQVFKNVVAQSPESALKLLHNRLRSTRGAAASIAKIDFVAKQVIFSGVGNVRGCLIRNEKSKDFLGYNGTLGLQVRHFQNYSQELCEDDFVVLHSDGLTAKWQLSDYPGLSRKSASIIAAVLHRDWHRANDDATIAVIRIGSLQ